MFVNIVCASQIPPLQCTEKSLKRKKLSLMLTVFTPINLSLKVHKGIKNENFIFLKIRKGLLISLI